MFNAEVREMLAQVLTSWQVLAATVVLIFYVFLVNYVVKARRRPSKPSSVKRKKRRAPKLEFPSPPEGEPGDEVLGLDDTAKN